MTVEWRPVPGFECYSASSLGQVRGPSGRILKVWWAGGSTGNKYAYVTLCRGKERVNTAVHLCVCSAFHGPRPAGKLPNGRPAWEADHIDQDPGNNAAANLEWVERKVNLWRTNGRADEALA